MTIKTLQFRAVMLSGMATGTLILISFSGLKASAKRPKKIKKLYISEFYYYIISVDTHRILFDLIHFRIEGQHYGQSIGQ
jgi:hypothetical protein